MASRPTLQTASAAGLGLALGLALGALPRSSAGLAADATGSRRVGDPEVRAAIEQRFRDELILLYGAHHQGADAARANSEAATLPALREASRIGAEQNLVQAERLRGVFDSLGLTPHGRPSPAMQGIIDANLVINAGHDHPVSRDLGMIAYARMAAAFYLSVYGTLRSYAHMTGNRQAAGPLLLTLAETELVDAKFAGLARKVVGRSLLGGFL